MLYHLWLNTQCPGMVWEGKDYLELSYPRVLRTRQSQSRRLDLTCHSPRFRPSAGWPLWRAGRQNAIKQNMRLAGGFAWAVASPSSTSNRPMQEYNSGDWAPGQQVGQYLETPSCLHSYRVWKFWSSNEILEMHSSILPTGDPCLENWETMNTGTLPVQRAGL